MSVTYTSIDQLLASPFQRLTSAMWNTAVLTLIQLYQTGGNAVTNVLQNGSLYLPGNLSAVEGDFLYEVFVGGQPVITEEDPIYISGFIDLAGSQIAQLMFAQQQLYSQLVYLPQDIYADFMKDIVPAIYESVSNAIATQTISKQLLQIPNQIYEAISSSPLLSLPGAIYDVFSSFLSYFYLQATNLMNAVNRLVLYLAPPAIEGLQLKVGTTPSPLYTGPSAETVKIILQNLSTYIIYIGNSLYSNFPLLQNSSVEFHVSNPSGIYAWATGPATVYALFEVIS